MTDTSSSLPEPIAPRAQSPGGASPITGLSVWTRWGDAAGAMAAVAARRRHEDQAFHVVGRSTADDPVVQLVLAAPRRPAYVQHDAGLLRTEIQGLRSYVAGQWQSLASDVDHVRRLDLVLDSTVGNIDTAVVSYDGPEAGSLMSAWQQCRHAMVQIPAAEVEAAAAGPGDVERRVPFERWRGQKAVLASYDMYVTCAPDLEGRLGIVAARLGAPVVDALHEISSLRVAAGEARDNSGPVSELRQYGDNVMAWNAQRITAFERTDLSIDPTTLLKPSVAKHRPSDAMERLAQLAQHPPNTAGPALAR